MQCSFTKPNSTSINNTSERQTAESKRVEGLQVRRLVCDGEVEGYLVYNPLSKGTN